MKPQMPKINLDIFRKKKDDQDKPEPVGSEQKSQTKNVEQADAGEQKAKKVNLAL